MICHIICGKYYNINKQKVHIGGVETYITNLIPLLVDNNYSVMVYQRGDFYKEINIEEKCLIISCPLKRKEKDSHLMRFVMRKADLENDLLLFATSIDICKNSFKKAIAIQHGIYWDVPTIHGISNIKENLSTYLKVLQTRQIINQHKKVRKMICVDYNYVNWLRSQTIDRSLEYVVIPNFAKVPILFPEKKAEKETRIVFSRRFEKIRGTELLVKAFSYLLKKNQNISLTIAGDGSQKDYLYDSFCKYDNVEFTRYNSVDSVQFHSNFDIAIIPTIGSEGTSLSLLEAMAAGCAVICTDVGGMSNIVLNGYNGIIISPNADELIDAVQKLISDENLIKKISENGYKTVKEAFSFDIWRTKWDSVLKEISSSD